MNGMQTAGTNVLTVSSPGLVYGGAPTQILVTSPISYPGGYDGTSSVTPRWYDTVVRSATYDASAHLPQWHVLYARLCHR